MYKFLGIDIKKLDDSGSHFIKKYWFGLFCNTKGMDRFNGLPTPTKVEVTIGVYDNYT